jgi:hypothetical protein
LLSAVRSAESESFTEGVDVRSGLTGTTGSVDCSHVE